jgi:hypothetical protein
MAGDPPGDARRRPPLRRRWTDRRPTLVGSRGPSDLGHLAVSAGVRRRFAPHQLRHAHAVEMACEGVPLVVIQRQLGTRTSASPAFTSKGSTAARSSIPFTSVPRQCCQPALDSGNGRSNKRIQHAQPRAPTPDGRERWSAILGRGLVRLAQQLGDQLGRLLAAGGREAL